MALSREQATAGIEDELAMEIANVGREIAGGVKALEEGRPLLRVITRYGIDQPPFHPRSSVTIVSGVTPSVRISRPRRVYKFE